MVYFVGLFGIRNTIIYLGFQMNSILLSILEKHVSEVENIDTCLNEGSKNTKIKSLIPKLKLLRCLVFLYCLSSITDFYIMHNDENMHHEKKKYTKISVTNSSHNITEEEM